ncbi:hypothetical protein KGA66_26580 [Actinocrinis puniceicyclus]|uniref:HNH endonuclease n=1 Tax=Actinocrinis puniceicyclus TaxID=977794 RepID=A0A8J7WQ56_9ACTN|nr:hypothetical protein [Actinocrinis puniceicyclus]MBS2966631.1 hypothetical protein [Actinocrinis puniceicyclus]
MGRGNGPKRPQVRIARTDCFFCGRTGKMTEEHVLPDWLNNLGYGGQGFREYIRERPDVRIVQNGGPFSKTLKLACRACNTQWMSGMETDAKPVLLRLFNAGGRQAPLERPEQITLARWGFKTAAVLSQVVRPGGNFPLEHRLGFHDQDRIPDQAYVRIGTASITQQPLGIQLGEAQFLPREMTATIDDRPTTTFGLYFARFRLLNVVFEVIGHTAPPTLEVAVDGDRALGLALLPLWPSKFETLWWPPTKSLDEIGGLDGLAQVPLVGIPTLNPGPGARP